MSFDKLNKIKLKVEKKGRFNYASWVEVWAELKKVYPDATCKVYERESVKDGVLYSTGLPIFKIGDKAGAFVKVGITIGEIEHIEFYPILNTYNKAIPYELITVFDINTAIQRAKVKAIAHHGLGLYVYAGEDLPEED